MRKLILSAIFSITFASVSFSQKDGVSYNFDCLNEEVSGSMISLFGNIEAEILANVDEVSIQEELKMGDQVFKEISKKYRFVEDQIVLFKLNSILSKVVSQISKPKGFNYQIYVLDTTELNAFTIGGRIFYTTEMLKFCKNDDEIAAVIGHEVGHNELGSINDQLKRLKNAQMIFGEETGQLVALAGKMLTVSFNQKIEAHCDMYGVDLSISAGYNGCDAAKLWQRMHDEYEKDATFPKLLMSHPYSAEREKCLKSHMIVNYSTTCK